MFEKEQIIRELEARLKAKNIDPADPQVKTIVEVINTFYAEQTQQVLQMMQGVLAKIQPG